MVCFRSHLEKKISLNKQLLEQLPDRQQQLLRTYKDSLNTVQGCVEHNQDLIALIIENIELMFENANPPDVTDVSFKIYIHKYTIDCPTDHR